MPTTQQNFELTAKKAESQAQSNLGIYKVKLFLFALLGYVIIFAVLLALIAIVVGLVFLAIKSTALLLLLIKKKLILLLIPLIWVLASALWVRLEAPKGYAVSRRQLPTLFATIDKLSQKLKSPKVHEVLLTPEFNAAIVQTPRLGIFGWNRNTLILGVELLLVLSPKQAESVIAHELGHLSGNHSRFAGWIYRVRSSWYRIMEAFERKGGFGASMMGRIFDWYAPKFAAYSFALARANEYEADAMAAEVTNPQVAADALVNAHVAAPYVDENYWRSFFQQADDRPAPEKLPWAGLGDWLAASVAEDEKLQDSLEANLRIETGYADTHPSISDRLKALGIEPRLPDQTEESAATAWFTENFEQIISDFDADWSAAQSDNWRQRYEYVVESKQTLKDLSSKSPEALDDGELWQKASLTEEFDKDADPRPLYEALQKRLPDNPAVAFALGRLSFDRNDDELLKQMKIAVQSPNYAIDASRAAYAYLEKLGRTDEGQQWLDAGNRQSQKQHEANQERASLSPKDPLLPADISEEATAELVKQLRSSGKVKRAWLAQKQLKHYPEHPALAIAVVPKGFYVSDESCAEAITEFLNLDCAFFVVLKRGDYKKLAKRIIREGQRIL